MVLQLRPSHFCLVCLHILLTPLLVDSAQAVQPTADPLGSLARLLGVQRVPAHLRGSSGAPLFLRRLFDSVSEADGRAVRSVPYHSDSVVAYADWATGSQTFYNYNLTRLPYQGNIRYADLHLFRAPSIAVGRGSRRRRREAPMESAAPSRIIKLKLYQVTDPRRRGTPFGNILLSQKLMPLDYRGWVVFEVSQAALSWIDSSGVTNHGLVVFAFYTNGEPVPPSRLGFVQRGENRDILQPALMVYASEADSRRQNRAELENNSFNRAFDSFDPNRYASVYGGSFALTTSRRASRGRRAAPAAAASAVASSTAESRESPSISVTCRRYPMYVDFAKVGWDEWIIGPPGFNAFFCSGHCPFPLGQQFHPSNHAVVQSIMNHLGPAISGPVQKPSCVPSKLDSISMLYYDDNDRVVLKQYDDMIALSCGCQ